MMLAFQKPLGIDRRHAPAPGGGNRLAVNEILHVTAGENTRNVGLGAIMGNDVAIWI